MTPNITTAKIIAQNIWNSNFLAIQQPNSRTLRPRVVFNNLTTLYINASKIELSSLGGLLVASPNLKTLTLVGASDWKPAIPVVKFSNLTTLTLGDCRLCHRGIKYLLKYCTKLVNFSYVQLDHSDPLGLYDSFDSDLMPFSSHKWRSPVTILKCLGASAATLQTIEIKFHADYEKRGPDMAPGRVQGELLKTVTGFPALKTLRLTQAVIDRKGNYDVLVNLIKDCPSLETLEILEIDRLPERDVAQFVRAALESKFPKLQTLKLDSPFFIHADDIEEMIEGDDDEDAFVNFVPDLGVIENGPYKNTLSSLGVNLVLNYCDPWEFM